MLSWDEILEIGKQHNKTVICEVERRGKHRYFNVSCNVCGDESYSRTDKISSCVKCFFKFYGCSSLGGRKRLCKNEFIKRSEEKHGNKYDYNLVDYINAKSKIKIFCRECKIFFEQEAKSHMNGSGCKYCAFKNQTMNFEELIDKCKQIHGNKFNYSLVKYKNSQTKIKIFCNKCLKTFEQSPSSHMRGSGCPKCNESKGENKVAKYLSDNNIIFAKNKIFKTLKDKRYLKPDFYLSELNLLIEYDGEGHYFPVFGNTLEKKQKNLEDCQRRDKIKNEWAKENNIPLLRIPYWDFDRIEELIEAFILKHTKKKEIKQLIFGDVILL
jgi:hypothetical protein